MKVVRRDEDQVALLVASDGLWEHIPPQLIPDLSYRYLMDGKSNSHAENLADHLCLKSMNEWNKVLTTKLPSKQKSIIFTPVFAHLNRSPFIWMILLVWSGSSITHNLFLGQLTKLLCAQLRKKANKAFCQFWSS